MKGNVFHYGQYSLWSVTSVLLA